MKKNKNFIGISGKMASGKTTLASYFVNRQSFQIFSVGQPIKAASNLLISQDYDSLKSLLISVLNNKTSANRAFNSLFERFQNQYISSKFLPDSKGGYEKTEPYRKLTQDMGDFVRKEGGDDVWVKYVVSQAKHSVELGERMICDDLRLSIEANTFLEGNSYLFRVDVDDKVRRTRVDNLYGTIDEERFTHKTEVDLDNYPFFDLRVDNTLLSPLEVYTTFENYLNSR